MPVTLKQLAELSGLSIRTVSRALRHDANVASAKREQVLALARKHHYVPNIAARNLKQSERPFIGIIGSGIREEPYIRKLYDLEYQLSEAGYYTLLRIHRNGGDLRSIFQSWVGLVNFVVVLSPLGEEQLRQAGTLSEEFQVRLICIDQQQPAPGFNLVIDRDTGIAQALRHLASRGRSRLLHCGLIANRRQGIDRALRELPQLCCEYLPSGYEFADGAVLGEAIAARDCDAVFFDTDRMALGFLSVAGELGLRVPEALSVIGFDDEPAGAMAMPHLSTVAHPVAAISRTVLEIVRNVAEQPEMRVFTTEFIGRKSS